MRSSDKGQMLRISLSLLSFGLAFGGVFSGTRALAQSTATLEGTVRDPSGAVAPGVKIAVRNQGTGVERTTETESDGNYVVPALERLRQQGKIRWYGITALGEQLFIADTYNHRIRVLNPVTRRVTTFAGEESGDRDGTLAHAR